ncbi:Ig-like domain-containing protein, partial [Acinetobacter rongchengensis]
VEIGTAIVDSTGNWSFTPSTDLAEGAHAIAISQKDAAGNESPKTTPVNFTVDSLPPTSTVEILGITDDSGVSTDFITNDNTLLFNGQVNGTLGADEKVQISLDGGVTWNDAISDANGTWTFDYTANPLMDGTYTVQAQIVDQAGNIGATATQDIVIDTTISVPAPAISMSNYDDAGVSSTDFYSNDTQFTLNVIG